MTLAEALAEIKRLKVALAEAEDEAARVERARLDIISENYAQQQRERERLAEDAEHEREDTLRNRGAFQRQCAEWLRRQPSLEAAAAALDAQADATLDELEDVMTGDA